MKIRHQSVLPDECIRLLSPKPGGIWVDCTCGGGGHTRLIAEAVGQSGMVITIDQDASMLEMAKSQFEGVKVTLKQVNFDQIEAVLNELKIEKVDGILADLGFSSDQMDDQSRGLSFRNDGPLDMRLNRETGQTAADLVNTLSEKALADLIYEFGEERLSRRIAKRIVERRTEKRFETTADLADCVRKCVPRSGGIDPATRTFQGLRIAVNDELGALDRLLNTLPGLLNEGGRAGLISFHSLEDRRVKQAFKQAEYWKILTKKPVEANEAEVAKNPRARSAKLRVAERISPEKN